MKGSPVVTRIITIGDRIRFSVELLKDIAAQPNGQSHVVKVVDIRDEADGAKIVYVEIT